MSKVIRSGYLETLACLRDRNIIKVVTGARRVGKSTLLAQFQETLLANDPQTPTLSINFDEPVHRALAEEGGWKEVFDSILQSLNPERMNYVFLDEVQNVPQFEKLLVGLFVHPKVDLYVTGSNACLLSSELAAFLTGRTEEVHVLPFSFAEYIKARLYVDSLDKAFGDYLLSGGFPEAVRTEVGHSFRYLRALYRSIYERDIKPRYKIHSDISYREVVNFLAGSAGSPVSPGNIAKILTNAGKKIDNKSAAKYISTLTDSYLFYRAGRYDIKGKQALNTLGKYYIVDTGLRNALLGKELLSDQGHLMENAVFFELLRRGNQVWAGKVGSSGIDFVARGLTGRTTYVQVALSVRDGATLARELAPFDKIPDHNEKILITADRENGLRNGIRQIDIVDWLLGKF
ncbi:MAG: ATP-binding protein [Chitinispirillia bacterium]|nr:ATP-binding protein [Chitinispirillia bacterium]